MNIRIDAIGPRQGDPSSVHILLPPEGAATAEDLAMIQAKYSRSPKSIVETIAEASEDAAGKFMDKFYVGYSHDSIADCAPVLFAIENVPLHVAKLIQHFPLYNGQECSTRYLDFSKQPMAARTPEGSAAQEKMRQFYLEAFEPTVYCMSQRHSLNLRNEVEHKAAKAAAFDVLRGFLPIGAHTSLSWSVQLRHVNEHCTRMLRAIADQPEMFLEAEPVIWKILELAKRHFPNSIKPAHRIMNDRASVYAPIKFSRIETDCPWTERLSIDGVEFGSCSGQIDFGSWRDLARHRSVQQTFPILDLERRNIHDWYLRSLPVELRERAALLAQEALSSGDLLCMPLATMVGYRIAGPLHAFEYISKLRSSHSVHPTLRAEVLEMARQMKLPVTSSDPEWVVTVKRGQQDIVRKGASDASQA